MKLFEVSSITLTDRYIDVREKIIETITKALNTCRMQGKTVDFDKLKNYTMEYFLCVDYRADDCIEEAIMRSNYNA